MPALKSGSVQADVAQADVTVAQYLRPLMLRNIASDGFVFTDPADPGRFCSRTGQAPVGANRAAR